MRVAITTVNRSVSLPIIAAVSLIKASTRLLTAKDLDLEGSSADLRGYCARKGRQLEFRVQLSPLKIKGLIGADRSGGRAMPLWEEVPKRRARPRRARRTPFRKTPEEARRRLLFQQLTASKSPPWLQKILAPLVFSRAAPALRTELRLTGIDEDHQACWHEDVAGRVLEQIEAPAEE